jgi:hypothetical protein
MPTQPAILSLLATALLANACYLPPPVYYVQERPGMHRVPGPPPAPRLEVPPLQPDESYLWREGYWAWDGNDYQWVAGAWIPPQAGYLFIASSVVFADGCWQYRPPYWCPESLCGSRRGGGHRDHGGHGKGGVIAHGPAVPVENPDRSARVRAPEAPDALRVRAPEAQASAEPVRVRAPEAPDLKDPDADAPGASGERLPAWQDDRYRTGRRPSITLDDGQGSLEGGQPDEPSPALRRRPEYLGTRAGRPVFGDDPTSDRPRAILPEHRTDATGAIVLAEPRAPRPRWGRVIVIRPDAPRFAGSGAPSATAAVGRIHGPDTTVAPPTLHRVPPPVERPSFAYRAYPAPVAPPPVVRPAPIASPVYRPSAPAPVYRPSAPAPVYRPSAPAPVYRPAAPSYHPVSAPQAPARVSAPATVSPAPGRRHR